MLQSLHVKNLALMEETEVSFGTGLNILTGETGAGKSLLIDSVNLALGAKFEKEMLRKGTEQALVELCFSGNEKIRQKLAEMDLEPLEDNEVLIARKMQVGKSVFRINGEVVTAKQVRELAEVLIDIHGQHEHQSLLHKRKHLEILDSFGGEKALMLRQEIRERYDMWKASLKKLEQESLDDKERAREQSLAEYEVREINESSLKPGEDVQLEETYRRMANSQRITEALNECYSITGENDGAGNALSRGLRALSSVTDFDPGIAGLEEQLVEVDDLLADFNRELSNYLRDSQFDEESFREVTQRLDLINRLKGKYGNTIEDIIAYGEERQAYLDKLSDYDAYRSGLEAQCEQQKRLLEQSCSKLSEIRNENAVLLEKRLTDALLNLNFLTVQFEISIHSLEELSETGGEEVEFLISTNPGEPVRPLGMVASGGELSRIMLAIKTVLAQRDEIDALIFDEIDTGISGRTAWQVSKQLGQVAGVHQVICITHLAQIAAMADNHFVIEKQTDGSNTVTRVRMLNEQDSLGELARLLGSEHLTEAALGNAKDMRKQALEIKSDRKSARQTKIFKQKNTE